MPGLNLTSFTTPTAMVIVALLGITVSVITRRVNRRSKPGAVHVERETQDQRAMRERDSRQRRVLRSRRIADVGTYVIASVATFAALLGMWPIARNSVALAGVPSSWITAASLVAVGMVEGTIIISGIRSRANIIAGEPSGADGIAMWVAVTASAVLSSLEVAFGDHRDVSAGEVAVAVLARMAAPVIAGFLWERGLAPERRAAGEKPKVHSLLTLRRLLVRLGLAAPHDTDLGSLDRGYRLSKVARHINNAKRRHRLQWWSRMRARASLITAVRFNAIQTQQGMSLGDHIGLHALAEALIVAESRPPMHLVDARQGVATSTAAPDQPQSHEAAVGHESLASGHPDYGPAHRRRPADAVPDAGQPRDPDPAAPTPMPTALNGNNVVFGFAAGIPLGTAAPAKAWAPRSQATVSLPTITRPDRPRRHTSGAPDAAAWGHPDHDTPRVPEVGPDSDPDVAPESGPTQTRRRRSPEEVIEAVRRLDPDKVTLTPNYVAEQIGCSWRRAKELLEQTGRLPVPEPQEGE